MHVFAAGIYYICSVNLILLSSLFIGKANTCCFWNVFSFLFCWIQTVQHVEKSTQTGWLVCGWCSNLRATFFFFRSHSQRSDSPTAILCRVRSTVTILCNNALNVDSTPAPRTTTAREQSCIAHAIIFNAAGCWRNTSCAGCKLIPRRLRQPFWSFSGLRWRKTNWLTESIDRTGF